MQELTKILDISIYFYEDYTFVSNEVSKLRIGLLKIDKGLYIMNNQHQVATLSSIQII